MRVGTVISLPDVALAELTGAALDFAWIDLEHGALCLPDVQRLAIGLAAAGCDAHVRLPSAASSLLGPIVDAGVDGIVIPQVEDAATAGAVADRLRYPPAGGRGFGPRRAGDYGRRSRAWELPPPQLTVQIESPAGVDAAAEIAAVPGVDAIVVGCADLSLALDAPQDLAHPELRSAVDRVAAACTSARIRFGIAAGGEPAEVADLVAGRADLLLYSADVRIYSAAVDAVVQSLEGCRATAA